MVLIICRKWCRHLGECIFSDEAWFHLSGYVNSQNSRFWSSENPNLFHEVPLHSQKTGCWYAISRKRIVGPIFFPETVTAEKYQEIIMQLISLLNEEEHFAGYSRMALPRTLQTQQSKCLSSSLMTG
jgi:hypothetical protein